MLTHFSFQLIPSLFLQGTHNVGNDIMNSLVENKYVQFTIFTIFIYYFYYDKDNRKT